MYLISIARAQRNSRLASLEEDDLMTRIEIASDWLYNNVEIGPYTYDTYVGLDEYYPIAVPVEVESVVQEAVVRLILRLMNSEDLNLMVRRYTVDSPDGGEGYQLSEGNAESPGATNDMRDIQMLLKGYRWRRSFRAPTVVSPDPSWEQ